MKLARLEEFRQAAYKYLGRGHDATFELTDAILLTRNIICHIVFSPNYCCHPKKTRVLKNNIKLFQENY